MSFTITLAASDGDRIIVALNELANSYDENIENGDPAYTERDIEVMKWQAGRAREVASAIHVAIDAARD